MTTDPGRLLFIATLAALVMLVVPAVATTAGTIVIYGNASGTHLDLSEDGGRLVVEGRQGGSAAQGLPSERRPHQVRVPARRRRRHRSPDGTER